MASLHDVDTYPTIDAAIAGARTERGRLFGAWVRDLGTLDAARAMLDAAGVTKTTGAPRQGRGVTAEILDAHNKRIDIMLQADDEPEVWAAGPAGYLHPGDRPTVD